MVLYLHYMDPVSCGICSCAQNQISFVKVDNASSVLKASKLDVSTKKLRAIVAVKPHDGQSDNSSNAGEKKIVRKSGKKEHHVWQKRDSAGSGQKALNLVRTISGLPNEKEAVYSALDELIAWEIEFPLIAAAKALRILKKRNQWKRIIQVAKWMLNKGQGTTMATYDTLLLAFDMDGRMISVYDHHHVPDKVIEVFADMEELGVKPDEDTVRRVSRAFKMLGQEDKQNLVMKKYGIKWKYIHFKGERVRVRT